MTPEELALEEYKILVGLLGSYLTLVLTAVTLALSATAAVVAFVENPTQKVTHAGSRLLVPAALCGLLAIGFFLQIPNALSLKSRLDTLALTLKFELPPHTVVLIGALAALGLLLLAVGITLLTIHVKARTTARAVGGVGSAGGATVGLSPK